MKTMKTMTTRNRWLNLLFYDENHGFWPQVFLNKPKNYHLWCKKRRVFSRGVETHANIPHFGLEHLHFLTSIHNTIHHQKTTIFPTINHCKVYKSTPKFTIKPGLEPGLEHVRTITRSRPCCSSSQLSWLLGAPCGTCGTPQRTLRLAGGFQRSGAERSGSRNWAALVLGLW